MAEPILTVEHLVKGYGENTVLDDVSLAVRPGEVIVVVGPSGCGKSTLLRCINALEPTQSGRVRLGNETVAYGGKGLTSLRQRIGMVFQSYELFPHLTVLDNVILAPQKVAKRPKAEVQQEAELMLNADQTHVMRVVEAGINGDETLDDIVADWNAAWDAAVDACAPQ